MRGTLVAVLLAVVHEQNVERVTDSALHGRVELPFKAAVETTERVPGIGMFLAATDAELLRVTELLFIRR